MGMTTKSLNGFAAIRPIILLLSRTLLVPLATALPFSGPWSDDSRLHDLEHGETPPDSSSPNLYAYLGVGVALVLLGGAFAGLTIALMGQDETYLQVIATSGEGAERRHATNVLNLLKRGKHWVLVTLLLSNVITNETLPIVLDRSLGGGWPAVLSSTILIVIFGEIVPQSICVRYGLGIGAFCAPLVLVLMYIMCPVAWPTAKLLDYLLGEDHGTMYKKAGLKTLVKLHKTLGSGPDERLMDDEVTIINSVLDLKDKPVGSIMTPMGDVFTMSADTVLDERMMDIILSQGYSRIPIHAPDNRRNFIGMLLVKILITYDPEDGRRVRDFSLATLPETAPHTSCLDIINFFQEGKSHMVLVSDFPGQNHGAMGVVTLEDVIEELIGEEIIDESDVFVDVHKAIRRLAPAPKFRWNKSIAADRAVASEAKRNTQETEPLLGRDAEDGSSGAAKSNGNGGPPGTTFLMRRKSSGTAVESAVRVSDWEANIRPHLKHLGPSNAASHPRATKFTSVKIKPGVGTIPEDDKVHSATEQRAPARPTRSRSRSVDVVHPAAGVISVSPKDRAGEVTSLLRPSGGLAASGGAAVLRAGYGSLGESVTPDSKRPAGDPMSAEEASTLAQRNAERSSPGKATPAAQESHGDDFLQVPLKMVVGETAPDEETDEVGDLSASRQPSMTRRATRSGSITETTIDVGGTQKVVLEARSSSGDDAEGSGEVEGCAEAEDRAGEDEEPEKAAPGGGKRKKRGKKKGKKTN